MSGAAQAVPHFNQRGDGMSNEKREDPRIYADRFHLLEQKNFVHCAIVEDNIKLDELVRADYWSHVAGRITQGDTIVVRNDSFSLWAELLVVDVGSGYAKVHMLRFCDFRLISASGKTGSPSDYEISFRGPGRLHIVIRKSDQVVVKECLRTRADAESWITDFVGQKPEDVKEAA
jgi:hypothetical protein